MLDLSPTTGVEADENECICIDCEYNLHGLPLHGRCPECALPISESHDAFAGQFHIPIRLRIVSGILILIGLYSVLRFFPLLLVRHIELPIETIGIGIGFGLLRMSKGWRIAGLVCLGIAIVVHAVLLPFAVFGPAASDLELFKIRVALVPKAYVIAFIVLRILLVLWMIRVLIDPRLRARCAVLGPRMQSIKPLIHWRYRTIMTALCGGTLLVGLLITGLLGLYAKPIEDRLLKRAESVRAGIAASKPAAESATASAAQINLELSWEFGKYSYGGPHFESSVRDNPLTGRLETIGGAASSSGIERIDSKDYNHLVVSDHGRSVDDVPTRALDLLYWIDDHKKDMDIRLTCRVPVEITFDSSQPGTLVTDVKADVALQPPYLLQAGEYHFHATSKTP